MVKPQLKKQEMPMPYLQMSKCTSTVNAVLDNGRIVSAAYAEIWLTEYDLDIILDQYKFKQIYVTNCYMSVKQYLPRWFTDYVYNCFADKTRLKHKDKVLYSLAKSRTNANFGMTCQRVLKDNINENYDTGEFTPEPFEDPEQEYNKEITKSTSFLLYYWGVWTTSIVCHCLMQLGKCAGTWYYSDTDSCFGEDWDEKKIKAYNESCKARLKANGYGPVIHEGREYWLGVAESDPDEDIYSEFKYMGAKRYACRYASTGDIKITVAGVPKKAGAKCLDGTLDNFFPGFVFQGEKTQKKTHTYIQEEIHIDEYGNECGNSVDLTLCDYKLDSIDVADWEDILEEEIEVIDYEGIE